MSLPSDHTKTTMQLSRQLRKVDKRRIRSSLGHYDGCWIDNITGQSKPFCSCSALSMCGFGGEPPRPYKMDYYSNARRHIFYLCKVY